MFVKSIGLLQYAVVVGVWAFSWMVATGQPALAQQAGQVVFQEDFGVGVFPTGQPLPPGVTTLEFFEPPQPANFDANAPNNGIVDDGLYTIGNNAQQANAGWADIPDNTPGDTNGLMLIVNARENELVNGEVVEDEFYRQTVSLTSNTSFDFLASLVPTNSVADEEFCRTNFGALILPNVRFSIQQLDGTVLAETVTGEIPFSPTPAFRQFALTFATSSATNDIQIVLSNIAPGGCGNDIAIDDIIFRISITAAASDDRAEVTDATSAVPNVVNVVANDTLDGAPFPAPGAGSNTVLSLAAGETLPPELTFDVTTGAVGVVAGAANGTFGFAYEICETSAGVNCAIASVAVTVNAPQPPPPPGGGTCPAGQTAVAQTGFALNAIESGGATINGPTIPELINTFVPDGTVVTNRDDPNDGLVDTFFPSIDLDLTGDSDVLIPENSIITLTLGPFFSNNAVAQLQASIDGTTFTSLSPGSAQFGSNSPPFNMSNTIRHLDVMVPTGGLRFVRIDQQSGGFYVGGARRTEICQPAPAGPQLEAVKTVEMPVGVSYFTPGEDVIYAIEVANIGVSSIDPDTIFIVDTLPGEVSFINDVFTDAAGQVSSAPVSVTGLNGAVVDFVFSRDVGVAPSGTNITSFNDCSPPSTLTAGPNPAVRFICLNPKGSLAPGDPPPTITFRFSTRIN